MQVTSGADPSDHCRPLNFQTSISAYNSVSPSYIWNVLFHILAFFGIYGIIGMIYLDCYGQTASTVNAQEAFMKEKLKIDSDLLIRMKNLSGLTVESIAEGSHIPLGTAQKIFSGITKKPRHEAAYTLYEYLLPHAENKSREFSQEISGYDLPLHSSPELLREPGSVYGISGITIDRTIKNPRDYIRGNLARPMKNPGEYTIDDYRSLPDDRRMELIDGFFYDLASPSTIHQRLSGKLFSAIFNYISEQGGPCEVFSAPFDVQLDSDEKTMVQPDIVIVCDPQKITEWGLKGAPDLVIEILSPSTAGKDRTLKMIKYREAGVREYWLVDPEKEYISAARFEKYMPVEFYPFTAEVPVGIYDGKLKIRLKE